MRPIIEWCVDCYSAGNQVLATETVNGDPLCKPCAVLVVGDSKEDVMPKPVKTLEEKQRDMRDRNNTTPAAMTVTKTATETETKIVKREEKAEITVAPKPPAVEQKADNQLSITLESGGMLTLMFDCGNFFELSKEDRNFVYSIIDRMRGYGTSDKKIPQRGAPGEKLFPVMMPLSALEDVFNNACGDAEAAAVYAAWWRSDPAVKPIDEGGK